VPASPSLPPFRRPGRPQQCQKTFYFLRGTKPACAAGNELDVNGLGTSLTQDWCRNSYTPKTVKGQYLTVILFWAYMNYGTNPELDLLGDEPYPNGESDAELGHVWMDLIPLCCFGPGFGFALRNTINKKMSAKFQNASRKARITIVGKASVIVGGMNDRGKWHC
jgi:hypothetical protein